MYQPGHLGAAYITRVFYPTTSKALSHPLAICPKRDLIKLTSQLTKKKKKRSVDAFYNMIIRVQTQAMDDQIVWQIGRTGRLFFNWTGKRPGSS